VRTAVVRDRTLMLFPPRTSDPGGVWSVAGG
jgi:hypothetical protein